MLSKKQKRAAAAADDPDLAAVDPVHVCCHVLAGGECDIRPFSMCNALEGREVEALEKPARPTRFEARHQFLRQGEPAVSLFNITDGVVCLSRMLGDGRRQVMGFLLPGDFFDLPDRRPRAHVSRRNRKSQHLRDDSRVDAESGRSYSLADPLDPNGVPDSRVQLHFLHPPPPADSGKGL